METLTIAHLQAENKKLKEKNTQQSDESIKELRLGGMNMNKNYMEEVAKMLGVELGEEFGIRGYDKRFKFAITKDGLKGWEDNESIAERKMEFLFSDLIKGKVVTKNQPWKPTGGDYYWHVKLDGCIFGKSWDNSDIDKLNYKLGNCFETCKEITPEMVAKFIEFFDNNKINW